MRRNKAYYKPNHVQIELTQGCNRRCSFCGSLGFERKFYYTDLSLIKKVCRLIRESKYNPRIVITGHGEPTLHPQFMQIAKEIRKELPDHFIQLITNGYLFNKNRTALFETIKIADDILLDDYDNNTDLLKLQDIVMLYNSKNKVQCKIEMLVPGVAFYGDKNRKSKRIIVAPNILDLQQLSTRKLSNHCGAALEPVKEPYKNKCSIVFRDMLIRYNGAVCLCCDDFRGEYYVASFADENVRHFDDVWRHERMECARRFIFHEGRDKINVCSKCNKKPQRPGLLPDPRGKEDIEYPDQYDLEVVSRVYEPLTKIVKREWEKN